MLDRLEREGRERFEAVRALTGRRAVVLGVSIGASTSTVATRFHDFDVFERLIVEFAEGRSPQVYAAELEPAVARLASNGRTLLVDQSYQALESVYPGLDERMSAIVDVANFTFVESEMNGRRFLLGTPRP
ncbi:MAG: hypothetical protein R3F34_17190 [Planctomycetota bacterium]